MTTNLRLLFLILCLSSAVMLGVSCVVIGDGDGDGDGDDDDTVEANDDDIADDDDDDSEPGDLTLSGTVIAVDQDSGVELTSVEYSERGGPLIVYLTTDPANVSNPLAKFTMQEPGSWQTTMDGDGTEIFVVVIADSNNNRIIDQNDMLREYVNNPQTVLDEDLEGLDVILDLPSIGGGGDDDDNGGNGDDDDDNGGNGDDDDDTNGNGGDDDDGDSCTTIEGDTVLLEGVDGEIVITANSADLGVGPFDMVYLNSAGPYTTCIQNSREYTSLVAIHDSDGNGFFEPSDAVGVALLNPIALGIGDISGVTIEIPAAVPITLPTPPAYVYLEGDVVYPGYTTGDITVYASVGANVYSSTTTPGLGGFSLRSPPNTDDVRVWAVVDQDGNGSPNPVYEPSGQTFIDTLTFDVQGLFINVEDPLDNSISGTVTWGGLVSPGDSLQIALHDDPGGEGTPVESITITNPVFPQAYSVPALLDGTYYVTGYLDIGGDGGGASMLEPLGIYEDSGGQPEPIVLLGNSQPANIDFALFEPTSSTP